MGILALEIFIGLVFVYLIHSLYITVLAEMISTWFGMRGRMLRQGITYLLTDLKILEEEAYKLLKTRQKLWWTSFFSKEKSAKKILEKTPKRIRKNGEYKRFNGLKLFYQNFFLIEHRYFKNSKAEEFYSQPSIKFLSQGIKPKGLFFLFRKSKPSYISKENFSSTLINMLRKEGEGIHDWAKVSYSVTYNSCFFEPETHKQLFAFLNDADDDMQEFKFILERWFEEMMQRINGWYKRKMRLIVFVLGVISTLYFNVNTLSIIERLSNDEKARRTLLVLGKEAIKDEAIVGQNGLGVRQIQTKDEDLKIKDSLPQNVSPEERKEILEGYIADINEILGPGWKEAEKIDTIQIPPSEIDKYFNLTENNFHLKKELDNLKAKIYSRLESNITSIEKEGEDDSNSESKQKEKENANIPSLIKSLNRKISVYQANLDSINKHLIDSEKNLHLERLDATSLFCTELIDGDCSNYSIALIGPAELESQISKISYKAWGFFSHFLGLLLTMLALYLGAPFWFDLLKKLISLRGTGVRPTIENFPSATKSLRSTKSNLGKTVISGDSIDQFLYNYSKAILNIHGVFAVNKVIEAKTQRSIAEVTYSKRVKESMVRDSLREIIPKNIFIDNILRFEKASFARYFSYSDLQFGNSNDPNSIYAPKFATLSGLVRSKNTDDYLLVTCAHTFGRYNSSFIYEGEDQIEILDKGHIVSRGIILDTRWYNFLDAAVIDPLPERGRDSNFELIKQSKAQKNKLKEQFKLIPDPINFEDYQGVKEIEKVFLFVRNDGSSERVPINGRILEKGFTYPLSDKNGKSFEHRKLIKIRLNRGDSIQDGDSGALILTKIGDKVKSIGICIGGFTAENNVKILLAYPMDKIFDSFDLTAIK